MENTVDYQKACEKMVTSQLMPVGIRNESVLQVMRDVPRQDFLPQEFKIIAYAAKEIPLSKDRSLSEPIVVGKLLQACVLNHTQKILLVGDASGYLAVLAAENAAHITVLDKKEHLEKAEANILSYFKSKKLDCHKISFVSCENFLDYQETQTYDIVIIHGAIRQIPENFTNLLSENGALFVFLKKNHICEFTKVHKAIQMDSGKEVLQKELICECSVLQNNDFNPKPTFKF
jgi:protein-L-isoaspartate(D-aspartate) O-methyltransferase